MNQTDEKIRKAAQALAEALTEGGHDYMVNTHAIEVTHVNDYGPRYAYEVRVTEMASRDIAP